MRINTTEVSGVTIAYLHGDIKSTTSGEVMDSLVKLVNGGVKKLVVNVKEVDFISSAGLRSILVASKLIKNAGGGLRICSANDAVAKVLETSGFTDLVSLHSDEVAAVSAFN